MITAEKLIELASYFSTISHANGRIRLRVSPKIVEQKGTISINDIENLPKQIEGINKIKINKLIGSITIEYNPSIFKKELWDNLVEGENLDEVAEIINKLYKEVA
ncbi:MAG: hypothetical protein HF962_03580 [Sulfurovum sp.]|nr:hypothetical protein [Sulfurovum sp.]